MASLFKENRGWGGQLFPIGCGLFILVACFVCGALVYNRGLPFARSLPWEHVPSGLGDTLDYFLAGDYPYLPRDVVISELLRGMAPQYGFTEYDIQAMVAAAARLGIDPEHIVAIQTNAKLTGGFRDMYPLALAIGKFLSENGYHDPPQVCPTPTPPPSEGTPVPDLPIYVECVPKNPKHEAIKAINPDGGEAWLARVLATAGTWAGPLQTTTITPTRPRTILHEISVLIEMVRLREAGYYQELVLVDGRPVIVNDPGTAPGPYPDVPDGFFICPYDGCVITGYDFLDPVYVDGKTVLHPGVDLGGAGRIPVVAACNGEVTYAGWMNSASLWISGNVVAIECFSAETDPTPICTLYGHGLDGSMQVGVGQEVDAGDWLFTANNTGFSSGDHLHFDIRAGGGGPFCNYSVDPKVYLP